MRSSSILLALVLFSTSLSAQTQIDPARILAAADSACAHISTVRYSASFHLRSTDGVLRPFAGKVFAGHESLEDTIGCKVRIESVDSLLYTFDGVIGQYTVAAQKKTMRYPSIRDARGFLDGAFQGFLFSVAFLPERPFASYDTIARYAGTTDVAGVLCHVIRLTFPDNDQMRDSRTVWYFGVEDGLPRMRETYGVSEGIPLGDTLRIEGLRVDTPLRDTLFAAVVPAGYELMPLSFHRRDGPKPLEDGTSAPAWTLDGPGGRRVSLADLRGRVVVLDFWYLACFPCLKAMPALNTVQQKFDTSDVVVIGINVADTMSRVLDYAHARGFDYRFLFGGADVARAYGVPAYPTLYVIDRKGQIVFHHVGLSESLDGDLTEVIVRTMHD